MSHKEGGPAQEIKLGERNGSEPRRVVAVAIFFDKSTQLVHLRIRINRYKPTRPDYSEASTRRQREP